MAGCLIPPLQPSQFNRRAYRRRGSEGAWLREDSDRGGVAGDCLAPGGLAGSGMAGNPDPSSVSLRSLFVA